MVNFHSLCDWAESLSYDAIPLRVLAGSKARLLVVKERKLYQNSSVLWASSHLGGQFDGALEMISKQHTRISAKRWLTALVAATEVSARIGAGLVLSPSAVRQTYSILSFNLILEGVLKKKNSGELRAAMQLAFQLAPLVELNSTDNDWHLYQLLLGWSRHCLDNPTRSSGQRDLSFLQAASTELGTVWMSDMVSLAQVPGPLEWQPAILGVIEILQRHIKAADKRLRIDQIASIELHLPHQVSFTNRVIHKWLANYIIEHEWCPALFREDWQAQHSELIHQLVAKIVILPSMERTAQHWNAMIHRLANLFSGVSAEQIIDRADLKGIGMWKLDREFRANLAELRYQTHFLEQRAIEQFQYCIPTETFVYTTRGGKWPERRSAPSPNGGMAASAFVSSTINTEIQVKGKAKELFGF